VEALPRLRASWTAFAPCLSLHVTLWCGVALSRAHLVEPSLLAAGRKRWGGYGGRPWPSCACLSWGLLWGLPRRSSSGGKTGSTLIGWWGGCILVTPSLHRYPLRHIPAVRIILVHAHGTERADDCGRALAPGAETRVAPSPRARGLVLASERSQVGPTRVAE
jgi:hypothetical protein